MINFCYDLDQNGLQEPDGVNLNKCVTEKKNDIQPVSPRHKKLNLIYNNATSEF